MHGEDVMSSDIIDVMAGSYKPTSYDLQKENKRKRNVFFNLPRWKKSNMRIKLRNRIKRENLRWGHRLFFTKDCIYSEARCGWCDLYFPSLKDRFTVYSAYLYMAQDQLEEIAEKALEAELDPLYDKYVGHSWKMKVAERDTWGRPISYTDADPDRMTRTIPELDNMSYFDYRRKRITEYLQENKPVLYENYKVDINQGHYGLFLTMQVDEELITPDVINKRIEHFYNLGEPLIWKAENPIPESNLIYDCNWREEKQISLGNAILYSSDQKI